MTLKQQGIFYSSALHLLVLTLLFIVQFKVKTPPTREIIEFIMIDMVEPIVVSQPATTRPPAATENRIADTPTQDTIQHQTEIDLPVATYPDIDPVDISALPQRADRNVRGNVHGTSIRDSLMRVSTPTVNVFENPQSALTNPLGQGSNIGIEGFADEIKQQTGNISQFILEGEVINRTVLNRVLPEFPENIMRNATVVILFSVAENGSVQNISFSRRSEPEFERASENALRQWTFNRADRTHTGQITFNFILKSESVD